MAYGTRAAWETIRVVAFGSINATFTALGGILGHHTRQFRFVNTTNADISISVDGATEIIRMAAGSSFVNDLSTNKVQDDGLFLAEGTQFYIQYASGAPTSGSFWLEVMYAQGGI